MFSFISSFKEYNPFSEKVSKLNRYWVRQSVPEVIQDADKLFDEEKYLEVYELLNRLKFDNNVDIQWRICRALFKMSCETGVSKVVRSGMIQEAYDLISTTLRLGNYFLFGLLRSFWPYCFIVVVCYL